MRAIIERKLDKRAAANYLISALEGGRALSASLLSHFDLRNGSFTAFFPRGSDLGEPVDFRAGGKFPLAGRDRWAAGPDGSTAIPVVSAHEAVARSIKKELALGCAVTLLENPMATPSDPWLTNAKSRVLQLGRDVFHLLLPEDDVPYILASLREASGHPASIGVVASPASLPPVIEGEFLVTERWIDTIASAAQTIFAEAFDGESYVFWRRQVPET